MNEELRNILTGRIGSPAEMEDRLKKKYLRHPRIIKFYDQHNFLCNFFILTAPIFMWVSLYIWVFMTIVTPLDPPKDIILTTKRPQPCTNFNGFACPSRSWNKKPSISEFVQTNINSRLKTILEEPISRDEPDALALGKNLYASCKNKAGVERVDLSHIQEIIQNFGGFTKEDHKTPNYGLNWADVLIKFKQFGVISDEIMSVEILQNSNRTKYEIHIKPVFPKEISDLDAEESKKVLSQKIVGTFKDLEMNDSVEKKETVFQFFNDVQLISQQAKHLTKTSITIEKLNEENPLNGFGWQKIIKGLSLDTVSPEDGTNIYIERLEILVDYINLLEYSEGMRNYLTFKLVNILKLSSPRELHGDDSQFKCVNHVFQIIPSTMILTYTKKYSDQSTNEGPKQIFIDAIKAFNETFRKMSWTDGVMKENALNTITSISSYSIESYGDLNVENITIHRDIAMNNPFRSILALTLLQMKRRFVILTKPFDPRYQWLEKEKKPQILPRYFSQSNSLYLPYPLLPEIFFDHERPEHVNYALLGTYIAREIVKGNMKWSSEFENKTKCFFESLRKQISLEGEGRDVSLEMDEGNLLKELFVEHLAVRVTYFAYSNRQLLEDDFYDHLSFSTSNKQLFWVRTAKYICSEKSTMNQKLFINSTVSSIEEFYQDFQCMRDSSKNSSSHCPQ